MPDEIPMHVRNLRKPLLRPTHFLPPPADGEPKEAAVMLTLYGSGGHDG